MGCNKPNYKRLSQRTATGRSTTIASRINGQSDQSPIGPGKAVIKQRQSRSGFKGGLAGAATVGHSVRQSQPTWRGAGSATLHQSDQQFTVSGTGYVAMSSVQPAATPKRACHRTEAEMDAQEQRDTAPGKQEADRCSTPAFM